MSSLTGMPSSQVLELVDQARYEEAVEILREKLGRSSESVSLRQQLADVLVLKGEHGEAIGILEKLADDYVNLGLSGKAVAVQKKIERIGKARADSEHELASRIYNREEELASRGAYRLSVADAPMTAGESGTRLMAPPSDEAAGYERGTEFVPLPEAFASSLLPQARKLATEETLEPPEEVQPTPEAVQGNPLFRELPPEELEAVISGMKLLTLDAGEVIVTEGEPGDALFVLTTGRVKAFVRDAEGRSHRVRVLPEGSFFGEVALLTGRPRTATIVSERPCELLKLDRTTLVSLTAQHPGILNVLQSFCAARLNSAAEALVRGKAQAT